MGLKARNSQSGMWNPGVTSTDRKMAVLQNQWAGQGYLPDGYQPIGNIPIPRLGYGASQQEEAAPQQIDPRLVQLMAARAQRGRFGRF